MLGEHPDELRADFAEIYRLDLDGLGRDYSTLHAAALLAQLPEGARTWRAYNADAAWTSDRALMAAMVNDLNWLVWSQTKDARHGRNRPRQIGPSASDGKRKIKGESMTPDDLMERIASIRREVAEDGQF